MQTMRSLWGQRDLTVADRVPTRALQRYLGTVHVGTPDDAVRATIQAQIDKARADAFGEADLWTDDMERETLRAALWIHEENRREYVAVMGASL